jgi:hypothetical protein
VRVVAAAAALVVGALVVQHLAFAAPQPSVTGLSASIVAPGTPVTISGSGFTGADAVHLGSASLPFSVQSDTSLSVNVPANAAPGTWDMIVSNGGALNARTAADELTVTGPAPVVTSIVPPRGVPAGGYQVTLRGTGLSGPGMRTAEVVFGTAHAAAAVNADGSLTVTVPPGAAGPVDVRVITLSPDGSVGQSSALGTQFTYDPTAPPPTPTPGPVVPTHGYRLVGADGLVYSFGLPSVGQVTFWLNAPVLGASGTLDGSGLWLVAADGGIVPFGTAGGYGSTGNIRLNQPVVGMAATPSGHGYWLVARDGGIFPFGDAGGYGSTGNIRLNQPIVGMAATPSGHGYWLVAADGGLFPFGDAGGYGSTGGQSIPAPIVGMAAA